MDIDRPTAGRAGPAFPLHPDKRADAVLTDRFKVRKHAHPVSCPVSCVQLPEPFAREPGTVVMVPAPHFLTGNDGTVPAALTVRCITAPAPVLFSEERAADGTVHAAGCDERGFEVRFSRHGCVLSAVLYQPIGCAGHQRAVSFYPAVRSICSRRSTLPP